ncbi:arginase family protein [Microbacterium sp. SSM24]|uniref:arginase family protein n=1 Tax=Microbacterium sp. SSM24 TaxID=2991714 RepID=UPI00222804B1|nr:arginase family protein [Microbacterium sp. SSM24]MCW3492112.1 arginase family protein [Microbacterium sp. SSM24]
MIALVAAPTNLGLRPPEPGAVPGTAKAPEALREAGLFARFAAAGARDAGTVLPGRYVDDDRSRPAGRVRNARALVDHARRLAARLDEIVTAGDVPLVIGGDCSLVIAAGLATALPPGRGLVHLDGHTDFRHPGNSASCASVAGEDLAAAVGLHWPAISDIDGRGPYFDPARTVQLGCHDDDEYLAEVRGTIAHVVTARQILEGGAADAAAAARRSVDRDGFWLQLDVDVLDPVFLAAVDSPTPGGLTPDALVGLLRELAPRAVGAAVTVFDPDLDPDGRCAALLRDVLAEGLSELGRDLP